MPNYDPYGRPLFAPAVGGAAVSTANPLPIADVGSGAVTILAVSTTLTAGSSGSVTLAGTSGKTTYIRGFEITSAAVIAVVNGLVTITGPTNTLNYYYDNLIAGQSNLGRYFGEEGIPASAANTAIVLNFPAITGGGATALVAWGYQL